MRDQLHKALKPIKDKSGLWWLFFWKWPALLRECHAEIGQLDSDVSMVRENFRAEQARSSKFEQLYSESREVASAAMTRASAEQSLSQNLSEELGNAKVQLQKSSETVGNLESRVARMEMESERLKAELAKTQAELTRSEFELEREKRRQQDTLRDLTLLREFVHRTHRLDIPTRRGVKALLAKGNRLVAFIALLLPLCLFAQFPPPFFRGVYTTNTAAWANTNVISLSTTNATSKPLTNHYQDGVLTLFGLEAGANITLTVNPSNIVITGSAGGGSGLTTNENQFLGVPLSIKSGALQTNVTFWQSNALLPALIATNQPGGTIDLVTMLTTNAAGLRVTSNGAVVVRGVIGSTTNSFEVRSSNNVNVPLAVTHSNTVRITGPSQAGFGASVTIGSASGSSQNNIELYAGDTFSGRWRSDSSGNQVVSAGGSGAFFFNTDSGSGDTHFQRAGAGSLWAMLQSSDVAAWHGGTLRRGQITNVWDVYVRSNVNWTEVGGSDRVFLQSTSGMSSYTMFLPITNGLAGQVLYNVGGGELSWKDDASGGGGLTTNANQFGESVQLTIKVGPFLTNGNWFGDFTNQSGSLYLSGDGSIYQFNGTVYAQSLANVSSPDLLVGSVSYNTVSLSAVGPNSVTLDGAVTPPTFFPAVDGTIDLGYPTLRWKEFWIREDAYIGGRVEATQYVLTNQPGLDRNILMYNTNGQGYTAFSGPTNQWLPTNRFFLFITNPVVGEVLEIQSVSYANGVASIVITNAPDDSGGGGLTTNANQFGAQTILTIKEGALLTNTLFYPSNLTGPATIHFSTTAQVTNTTEWRSTNDTIHLSISSNANAIVYGRLDMSNAVAFRTNNIDFRLPVYQAFTNALQTNLVLQLTNVYEGVTHRVDAYGAGRLGNGRTNAWQLLCTVAANHFIYWPPGTTNGNFDVLVNSNQIVSFTFMGGLGSTNILAAYRVLEGIGNN